MVRFGIVGVAATALHYGIYYVLQFVMSINVAFTLGYFLSFLANYFLTAKFTFKKNTSMKNGVGFGVAHLCNYLLQMGLLNFFVDLGVRQELAPIPVYCIAVPVNFLLVRTVFKKLK